MIIKTTIFLSVSLLILFSCDNLSTDDTEIKNYTEIQGKLSGILSSFDSPYAAIGTIFVDSLDKLVINPGVKILFKDSTAFLIRGELVAVGLQETEIHLTSFGSAWKGIKLLNSNKNSLLKFCVIENIHIDDSDSSDYGAVEITNSSASITNSIIQNNYSTQGGGITIIKSNLILTNNIFQNNTAVALGGAVLSVESTTEIINNTFYKNLSHNHGGGVVLISPQSDEIQNNIFFQNTSSAGDPRISIASDDTSGYLAQYNFLDENMTDPKFLSENDFHLNIGSPCRNIGNPDPSFTNNDGSRNDLGAYGGPNGEW